MVSVNAVEIGEQRTRAVRRVESAVRLSGRAQQPRGIPVGPPGGAGTNPESVLSGGE